VDDEATGNKASYRCAKGKIMPQSAEDAVAAVEQRRIDALIASDLHALDEIIDEHCTHIESNGTSRTKAAFLADVAKRAFAFDLFKIEENHIRIFGDTAIVAGTYRNSVRVRGNPNPVKHARHLRVYVNRGGSWKLVAHQATEIAPRSH
jgi:ketosteroid isomerase-like protein